MKKLTSKLSLSAAVLALGVASCVKQFNAKSYAPPLNIDGYTAANQIATSNLVAHWSFNGTLTDSLTNTTATANGSGFESGLQGQAYLGTANAYALAPVPSAIQNLHSFTVSLWYNMPENTTGAVELLGVANPLGFWSNLDVFFDNGATSTTGVLKLHVFNNGTSGTGTDAWFGGYTVNNPWGAWINVTLTYDDSSSTFVVYYNGASLISPTVVGGFAPLNWAGVSNMIFGTFPFQATPSLTSGASSQGWAASLTGGLDEVRFYNTALTSTEVSSLVALQHRGK